MGGVTDKVETYRRVCPVIFLLDTSGSMAGAPIGAVNSAMEGILPELKSMNNNNADAEIEIAILTFDSACQWITGSDKMAEPESYAWNDLNAAGLTAMGAAFRKLNEALSEGHGMMRNASGSFAPVLFLLSDGEPNDSWEEGLNILRQNDWYKVAIKVAVGYGPEANDDILRQFTGCTETVLHTNDPQDLKKLIRFVTITSSMIASQKNKQEKKDQSGPNDATHNVGQALQAKAERSLDEDDPDADFVDS